MMTSSSPFSHVFLVFKVAGSVKSMPSSPSRNLSKNTGRYVENTNKKIVFFFSSSKINKYYFFYFKYYFINFFQEAHFEVKFPLMKGFVEIIRGEDQALLHEPVAFSSNSFILQVLLSTSQSKKETQQSELLVPSINKD